MEFIFTKKALKDYKNFSVKIQNTIDKQISYLIKDIRYPSLRAKKYGGADDIWQIRINNEYRLYFNIVNDTYVILTIVKHLK